MDIENLSPEEQKAEQEALAEKKEEEVRASIISDLGFDETEDAEKIEKLVAKEMESHKKLSAAIGQKIKHRNAAEELRKNPPKPNSENKDPKVLSSEEIDKKIGEGVQKTLEQRDLDALEYPDELKAEIQRVATIQGVSIKKALGDPYIKARIDAYGKDAAAEAASVHKTGGKSGGTTGFKLDTPPDVDMSTPEGRKKYQDWKDWGKKQGG